jgi:ABC-type phosphate transport system substrate-binding protein
VHRLLHAGKPFPGFHRGSAELANYVAANNGSIGYTEVSFVVDPTRAAKWRAGSAGQERCWHLYAAPTSADAAAMFERLNH